jgi:predicted Zn-dependent protease
MVRNAIALLTFAAIGLSVWAQNPPSTAPSDQQASAADNRRQMLDKAQQDFSAEHWNEAFSEFSELHQQFPSDEKVSEFLAESSLNLGNTQLAISLLETIRKASPERWMASMLLARGYAEANRDADRDAEIANLQQLHDSKFAPKIAQLGSFLLERRVVANGSVRIWYALQPWGQLQHLSLRQDL